MPRRGKRTVIEDLPEAAPEVAPEELPAETPAAQEATLASPSGRTSVSLTMNPDGSWMVVGMRDGRTNHRFNDNRELNLT